MDSRYGPRLTRLIEALRHLPGVGPKSAQRMAFHLLERDREAAAALAGAVKEALDGVGHCPRCRMFCEDDHCAYCSAARSATGLICAVETPADLLAIESGTDYRGRYFVLMGRLSPIDGIGPEELGLATLEAELASAEVKELIVATNPSVEGEATAYYLRELARKHGVKVSRIAHGVALGGELEYVDSNTLTHAFSGRTPA
ncbi:MAG: recombination mediator RecR [Sinobacteraceae bacterium]|nr:recombination mediator RecR [Nevskiaceae bacterium]